jgi:uncharacterized peroxidase-related enzyme
MSRLNTFPVESATGELAETFNAIRKRVGRVPNAFATIGSNSPELLAQVLQLNAMLQTKSALSKRQLEAINLALSENSGCDYCVAAHTLMGKTAGFTASQTKSLRSGAYPEDPAIDALVKFVLHLVRSSGTLPPVVLADIRKAGLSDRQIVETIGAISAILLTNMLNRVNDTTLDFPVPS